MAQKNPKKILALVISLAAHAALIYYLGKIALEYALPEGTVSSYEIDYNSGEPVESVNVDVVSETKDTAVTPPLPPLVEKETFAKAPPAPKTTSPSLVKSLPAKSAESVAAVNEQGTIPTPPLPTIGAETSAEPIPETSTPAIDPFAANSENKDLEAAAAPTNLEPEVPAVAVEIPIGSAAVPAASGSTAGTVQSDTVLTPAAGNKKISYPTMARFRKLEGETIVHYTVSAEGAVTDVQLVQSSGHSVLDDSVLETVKTWNFNPTGASGVYERPVRFSLKGDATTAPSRLRRTN